MADRKTGREGKVEIVYEYMSSVIAVTSLTEMTQTNLQQASSNPR